MLDKAAQINRFVRSPWVDEYTNRHIAKIDAGALPEDELVSVTSEMVRLIGGPIHSPLNHRMGNATWKTVYDRRASRVDFGDADFLFSMPGSSLLTFAANAHRRLILHEIDAHPRVRNQMLEEVYGQHRSRAETYPRSFVERIEREMELANVVLVPGRVVREQMLSNGVPESKVRTVAYGVDLSVFRPLESVQRSASRRLQAVFTGQISLRKGVPFLIEAVRGQQIDLTLVGQIFDRGIVAELPENVRLAGVLPSAELAALYSSMDVFVLPSIEDNFGLVVTEAASAGLPVITTSAVGAAEYLSDVHTIVEPGSSRALRTALGDRRTLTRDERQLIAADASSLAWPDWADYAATVIREVSR
ncbi:glycosyltransferase family 4 protein [Microbacterium sp. No. 7]|uniref:glycosyltransferase family 4 protein n=1 Tax=Microbacterium sp. No. 7 TaxID=1714373 RepID=UPI0012E0CDB0|nr:glycosyltransferase family 4 protein [Microbacterium sp. No. 7]